MLFHEAHPSLADIWNITQGSVITRGWNSIFAWLPVFCGPTALSKAFSILNLNCFAPLQPLHHLHTLWGRKVPFGGLKSPGKWVSWWKSGAAGAWGAAALHAGQGLGTFKDAQVWLGSCKGLDRQVLSCP